jgi:hypothetical protein
VYLYVAKKQVKTAQTVSQASPGLPVGDSTIGTAPKTATVVKNVPVVPSKVTPAPAAKAAAPVAKAPDSKTLAKAQWQKCLSKTMPSSLNLFWNVKITEAIPAGGTYAKGMLNGDATLPVHVTLKADSSILAKIKGMLIVGKTAFLRGSCVEVAADGSVVLQAF